MEKAAFPKMYYPHSMSLRCEDKTDIVSNMQEFQLLHVLPDKSSSRSNSNQQKEANANRINE